MTDSLRERKQPIKKPVELYGETVSREGYDAFVYIGNGAAAQSFCDLFDREQIEGVVYEGLGGKADLCAIQYIKKHDPVPPLENGFTHREGTFTGYTVRRKREGEWEWFCEDQEWHPVSAEMPEKKKFVAGEIPDIQRDGAGIYVYEAKWEDRQGNVLDCGYQMFRNRLMAHAFGGMKGKIYHNTMAAYRRGILKGYKYFEVDLSMTVDGRLVLCHGWKESNCVHTGIPYSPDLAETMTYDKIMGMKVHGNPIIDARSFYRKIRRHRCFCYEIDFHKQNTTAGEYVRAMLEDFQYDEEVLDRILVQAYNQKMYRGMEEAWHFKYVQYLIGRAIHKLDDLIAFMVDEGICSTAIQAHLAKPDCVKKLRNAGIYVLAATVRRDTVAANQLLSSGVNTICTDFITDKILKKNTKRMGHYPFYIYYNSEAEGAEHDYGALGYNESLVQKTKAGNLEFRDATLWENDGTGRLAECRFSVPNRRFLGWNLRMRVDDTWFWYCQDGFYHIRSEFGRTDTAKPRLFQDREILPVLTVRDYAHLVMSAVWGDPSEEESI